MVARQGSDDAFLPDGPRAEAVVSLKSVLIFWAFMIT